MSVMDAEHEMDWSMITMKEKVGSGITVVVHRGLLDIEAAVKGIELNKGLLHERRQVAASIEKSR